MTTQSSIPLKWYVPFANGDSGRVELPVTTADPTRASQTLGFPPLTMQPPESGGVPPQGEDFNGGMNQVARIAWWVLNGGGWPYDATFATNANINGYPNGATLQAADFRGEWINTADNNQNNPDTNGTSWVPGFQYGTTALTGLTGGTVTPTPAQAAKGGITLAGTLTSALTVILPNWVKNWTFTNNTTGAFVVIVKTVAGAGITIPQNSAPTRVSGDGTNIVQSPENIAAGTQSQQAPQLGQIQTQAATAFTTAGTAPAFTLTPTPAITLAAPVRLRASFNAAGTLGSNTINVGGTGVKNLVQFDSNGVLQPANISNGMLSDIEYNGTSWVVMDPLPVSSIPRSYLSGFTMSNNVGAPTTTIDVAAGACKNSTNIADINLASTLSGILQAAGAWTAGNNQNKLDTGAKAISTWYHAYSIRKDSDGSGDILFSLSASAPTMPTGYTSFRRVGAMRTDASGNIIAFSQFGDQFLLNTPILDVNNVTFPTASRTLYTLSVPSAIKVIALTNITFGTVSVVESLYVTSPDVADLAPSLTVAPLATGRAILGASSTGANQLAIQTRTNTSSQIGVRGVGSAINGFVATTGWIDDRGRNI